MNNREPNVVLMSIFGPITYQNPTEWAQILAQAGEDVETLPLWYESGELGAHTSRPSKPGGNVVCAIAMYAASFGFRRLGQLAARFG
jgi:hypothetical protein